MGIDGTNEIGREGELESLMSGINERIEWLRFEMKANAAEVLQQFPLDSDRQKLNKTVYVEEVGSLVTFHDGDTDQFYLPGSLPSRDNFLNIQAELRGTFYDEFSDLFEKDSVVLNIGAGGDVLPVKSLKEKDVNVVSNDYSQGVVDELKRRYEHPVFACDLENLDQVLLPDSVDYVIGNSVLAYVDPRKLKKIVKNLCAVMKKGGMFTFDVPPNPMYFQIADGMDKQRVVNPTEADPAALRDYLLRAGGDVETGLIAATFHFNARKQAVILALLDIITDLFRENGVNAQLGFKGIADPNSRHDLRTFTLRVSKQGEKPLEALSKEVFFDTGEPGLLFEMLADHQEPLNMHYLDRKTAFEIAKLIGLNTDVRMSALVLSRFFQSVSFAYPQYVPREFIEELAGLYGTEVLIAKFKPYLDGAQMKISEKMHPDLIAEQVLTMRHLLSFPYPDSANDNFFASVIDQNFYGGVRDQSAKSQMPKAPRSLARKSGDGGNKRRRKR